MIVPCSGTRRALLPSIGALALAVTMGGCAGAGQAAPAWSFASAPSAAASAAMTWSSSTAAPTPEGSPSGPPASAAAPGGSAAISGTVGLGSACAAQWAASVSQYEVGNAHALAAFLVSKSGSAAPDVAPTAATLQTDKGPLELSVAAVGVDDPNGLPGATRLDLGLPVVQAGAYRAEFLDLTDASGTWRFRVGEFVIHVLPGSAPADLVREGGSIEEGQLDGGSVTAFELTLHNTTSKPIEVSGASTDIPGLPVHWLLAEGRPPAVTIVKTVTLPGGGLVTVQVGTMSTAHPVSFVLASPDVAYRVAGGPERHALFEPVLFESGLGFSDALAYRGTLPADACGKQRP